MVKIKNINTNNSTPKLTPQQADLLIKEQIKFTLLCHNQYLEYKRKFGNGLKHEIDEHLVKDVSEYSNHLIRVILKGKEHLNLRLDYISKKHFLNFLQSLNTLNEERRQRADNQIDNLWMDKAHEHDMMINEYGSILK